MVVCLVPTGNPCGILLMVRLIESFVFGGKLLSWLQTCLSSTPRRQRRRLLRLVLVVMVVGAANCRPLRLCTWLLWRTTLSSRRPLVRSSAVLVTAFTRTDHVWRFQWVATLLPLLDLGVTQLPMLGSAPTVRLA